MIEYFVMHKLFPDEPHRGPMSLSEAKAWVAEVEEMSFVKGTFYVGFREVTPIERLG